MSLTIIFNGPAAPPVNQNLDAVGIGTGEAFGTALITSWIAPASISSAESFGAAVVVPGAVNITVTGIGTFESFGTATLTPGAVTIAPTAIGTAEAFGRPVMMWRQLVEPSGYPTAEVFGTPFVSQQVPIVDRPMYYIARRGRSVRRYTR